MQKKVRVMRVTYPDIQVPQWQGRRLRGFFASGSETGSLLHNHGAAGKEMYRYPLVQYKILRKSPVIVAVEEGIREVHPLVMERQELVLGGQSYPCGNIDIELQTQTIGDTAHVYRYRFCAPWFGLNQANYRQYEEVEAEEKRALLGRILVGNLLSLSKGLGVRVERRLAVQPYLREQRVRFKEEVVVGFTGEFTVNFLIPELLGIGKSVSRGFGVVRRAGPSTD